MARTRQLIGILTLLTLVAIAVGVTGFSVPLPRLGGAAPNKTAALQGVKAVSASMLVKLGAGAPPGGELAFMAVEPSGNLVVTDSKRHTVMRFDPSGQLLTEWGPRLGNVDMAEPAGVAVSGDSYYVVDRGTPRIYKLDSSGAVQALFDLQPLGTYGLNGLAIDPAGNLYAADTGRNRILVFSASGQLIKQVGHAGSDLGGFTQPMMLAFEPDGAFVVADWENNRLERFDTNYDATDAWTTGFHSFGVATDSTGRVFAPDFDHRRIEAYTPQGASLGEMGAPSSPAIDVAPKQLALFRSALYVLGSDGVQRLDLQNTAAPPPQGAVTDVSDLLSLVAIVLMVAIVALALLSRRRRSLRPTLDRKVRLHAENGAHRQAEQAEPDQELLIAHQPERKE